eukprot:m.12238 g.12238  ORF g.12238 m.12238 type:complete len:299 (+) comp9228_c0_seq1:240-1136(+)
MFANTNTPIMNRTPMCSPLASNMTTLSSHTAQQRRSSPHKSSENSEPVVRRASKGSRGSDGNIAGKTTSQKPSPLTTSRRRSSKNAENIISATASMRRPSKPFDNLQRKAMSIMNANNTNTMTSGSKKYEIDGGKTSRKSKRYLSKLFKKHHDVLPPIQQGITHEEEPYEEVATNTAVLRIPPPPSPLDEQEESVPTNGEIKKMFSRDTFTLEEPSINELVNSLAQVENSVLAAVNGVPTLFLEDTPAPRKMRRENVETRERRPRVSVETISRRWRIDLTDAMELMHNVEAQNPNTEW